MWGGHNAQMALLVSYQIGEIPDSTTLFPYLLPLLLPTDPDTQGGGGVEFFVL